MSTASPAAAPDVATAAVSSINLIQGSVAINAARHAEYMQAHCDFLTERQRLSGVRVRLCSTGCYSLYNAAGQYIGRTTPPGAQLGVSGRELPHVALSMAMSEEMLMLLYEVSLDVEMCGVVSAGAVDKVRALLVTLGIQ